MALVYVETNYLMSIATGRDARAIGFLDFPASVRLVIPVVCYLEAISAFEGRRKEYGRLRDILKGAVDEAGRDVVSDHAKLLKTLLADAQQEAGHQFNAAADRFQDAFRRLAARAESIVPTAEILGSVFKEELVSDGPQDNLILHGILDHARRDPDVPRAFLSENTRDFGTPEAKQALKAAGVVYFSAAQDCLGFLNANLRVGAEGLGEINSAGRDDGAES